MDIKIRCGFMSTNHFGGGSPLRFIAILMLQCRPVFSDGVDTHQFHFELFVPDHMMRQTGEGACQLRSHLRTPMSLIAQRICKQLIDLITQLERVQEAKLLISGRPTEMIFIYRYYNMFLLLLVKLLPIHIEFRSSVASKGFFQACFCTRADRTPLLMCSLLSSQTE